MIKKNFLSGLLNPKAINPLSSRQLLAIDFSANVLKIAHLKGSGSERVEVVNVVTRQITNVSDEEIIKSIKASIAELNISNPEVINITSANLLITKNIEIPSIDPQEIKEIINLQAGRHTPYSREEIIVDYIDIGIYKRSYTKILLIIIPRAAVKRQFDILERSGLKANISYFGPETIGCMSSKLLKIETEEAPICIVHIDQFFTDFTVVYKNKLIFIRSLSIGAYHLVEEAQKSQSRFAEEIKRSFEAYQSEDIERSPALIVLTGAIEELRNISSSLGEVLRIPVKVLPYLGNFLVSAEAHNKISLVKYVSYLVLGAAGICQKSATVNLIPEELKVRHQVEERGKELIKTGIFILTIFLLVFFILLSTIFFKSAYLKKLARKEQPLTEETVKLQQDLMRTDAVKQYLSNRGYSLEVLTELYAILGDDIEVSDIRFDNQQRFTIRGTAEQMSSVFSFMENMRKSSFFKEVKTKYTTKRKEAGRDVTDFELNCLLTRINPNAQNKI